jgi:hypothetical protein
VSSGGTRPTPWPRYLADLVGLIPAKMPSTSQPCSRTDFPQVAGPSWCGRACGPRGRACRGGWGQEHPAARSSAMRVVRRRRGHARDGRCRWVGRGEIRRVASADGHAVGGWRSFSSLPRPSMTSATVIGRQGGLLSRGPRTKISLLREAQWRNTGGVGRAPAAHAGSDRADGRLGRSVDNERHRQRAP